MTPDFSSRSTDDLMSWNADIPAGRIIGTYSSGEPGPLIIAIAGACDDTAGGSLPIKAFVELLQQQRLRIQGSFIGLYGNSLQASELKQLLPLVDSLQRHHADICFVDFHTTLVPTIPYLSVNAHAASLRLARMFPLHHVTGLQRSIAGCFSEHCNMLGLRGFAFEAGQFRSAAAFSNQVAVLWLLLVFAGAIARRDVKNFARYERMLTLDSTPDRRQFRLASHCRGKAGDGFALRSGLRNFDPVRKASCIGSNAHGSVLAPADGFLLLPMSHGQANAEEGFFVLEEAGSSANDEDPALTTANVNVL